MRPYQKTKFLVKNLGDSAADLDVRRRAGRVHELDKTQQSGRINPVTVATEWGISGIETSMMPT